MAEFQEYEALKGGGSSAVDVYRAAHAAGLSDIDAIRMLRAVFGLTLGEAKETVIVGSGTASSLGEHEEAVARELRKGQRET